MQFKEFKEKMENIYHKKFPNSELEVMGNNHLYTCIWVQCYLSQNQKECANNIRGNDMFHISFSIVTENGEFKDKIVDDLDLDTIGVDLVLKNKFKHYITKPTNQYCVYGSRALSFRQAKGNTDKILKSFEKFVEQLYNTLMEDINNDNIHDNHIKLVKKKIGQ